MSGHLTPYKNIVFKIGSSLLVENQFNLRRQWLENLTTDIAALVHSGTRVMLVSSGAIAMGRNCLSNVDPAIACGQLELRESQAAAAIGQIELGSAYSEAFSKHGLKTAQILLTIGDTEERRRYLNARATIGTLLDWGIVPIINENDSVATSEIRYGDNDRLSARVASMTEADLLVLFSDVDGLFTAPPSKHPDAELVKEVKQIDQSIISMAGEAASDISRGGMKTKIDAASLATEAGVTMVIASGQRDHCVQSLNETGRGTWFRPQPNTLNARKRWIAGGLNLMGRITIDAGALLALQSGKSLLPAGVVGSSGEFSRGDAVSIIGPQGHVIGRGLIEYDSRDTQSIMGLQSSEIRNIMGESIRSELIHRDNLVLNNECL